MKFCLKTFVVFAFVALVNMAANALPAGEPLVIIRFNQQQVVYQDQLYNAVVQAVQTKPSVIFSVVGIAPVGRDAATNAKLMENTRYYTQRINDDLLKMGVNPQQVRFNVETSAHVENEEVQIFVQ